MKIHFLGHSCFYIEEGSFNALIDPYITNNPLCSLKASEFKNIKYIFVTHGHDDHLGDTIYIANRNSATVITNYEIASYLNSKGITTHAMSIGGRTKFDFGTVKMTLAHHGSGIETVGGLLYGGHPCGFVIEVNDKKIYHAGDTGLTMDMKLLAMENIDVAMLPIGGNFTMDIQDATLAVDFIQPKKVIPIHYNTFPLIEADPNILKENVKTSDVIILKSNESYTL